MSRPTNEEQKQLSLPRVKKGLTPAVLQAIEEVDEKLKYLSESVIPQQPYLLSIPTDSPYRVHKSFANCWFAGTPFQPHEEQLQYMSFQPHQNPGEELLKVVGGWSDAEGNLIEEDTDIQNQTLSTDHTETHLPSRKKISLKDYKTKDKSNHDAPVPRPLRDPSKVVMKSQQSERPGKAEEKQKSQASIDRKPLKLESRDDSRSGKPKPPIKIPTIVRQPDSPSPPKRRRLSSEDYKSESDLATHKSKGDESRGKTLPTLLSPTLPASKNSRPSRELPRLLSPELPAGLQKVLADVQPKRSDQVRSILGDALGVPTDKKQKERPVADSGRVRSDSQLSVKSLPVSGKTSPYLKPVVKQESRPGTPTTNGVHAVAEPRQRHRIALKYGKKNRKRVEALLKLAPRPKKIQQRPEELAQRNVHPPDRDAAKGPISLIKIEKKRQLEASPERIAKKLKSVNSTPERPQTPINAVKSPALGSATRKPQLQAQATPKKELKPSAMQRIASSDGADAKTPPIGRGRTSTPVGSIQTKESPAASSTPAVRDSDRSAWSDLNHKYFALGRQFKSDAQALATSKNESDQILSVVHHIEALLCFMVNLSAQSHSRPSIDPGWSTVMPYFIFVFKASRKYRHLHGLVIQLGAICRQIWHNHNIDRLSRDALPDEHCGSAPTPGSDGNTKTDDAEKYKRRYLEFRNTLVQNSRELQQAWLEGSRYLSPYLLEKEYPKTWSKRTKDTSTRGFDKINPTRINEGFTIPLDPNSGAFEATRFALAFMAEWTEREKIQWRTKIEL